MHGFRCQLAVAHIWLEASVGLRRLALYAGSSLTLASRLLVVTVIDIACPMYHCGALFPFQLLVRFVSLSHAHDVHVPPYSYTLVPQLIRENKGAVTCQRGGQRNGRPLGTKCPAVP